MYIKSISDFITDTEVSDEHLRNGVVQMLKDEKNDNIRMEILHNIPMLLNEKERFFSEVEIGELL